jgi:hypothetical protein
MRIKRNREKWTGTCSVCGKAGDTSSLFSYSVVTGEFGETFAALQEKPPRYLQSSHYQVCGQECLGNWVARKAAASARRPSADCHGQAAGNHGGRGLRDPARGG